jgi:hypothetical protein
MCPYKKQAKRDLLEIDKKKTNTQRGRQCKDGGRYGSDAATGQGMWTVTKSRTRLTAYCSP